MNLLSNAIDSLEEITGEKRITITTQLENANCVVVKIADNGAGLSPENQAKIFDNFSISKPTGVAAGLGLAISHQIIVERHGGKMTCKSEVGVGTEFVIRLCVMPEEIAPLSQQQLLGYGEYGYGRIVIGL